MHKCSAIFFWGNFAFFYYRLYKIYIIIQNYKYFSAPRTLKQMCRVEIYNMIGRRPAVFANKLPLPQVLREYLLNFEP